MRVSVIGGSIGGLAAAVALHKAGARVRVYERRSVLRDEGTGIGLRPQGVEGLTKLGVSVYKPVEWRWRYGSARDGNARISVEWKTSLIPYTYTKLKGALTEVASDIDYRWNMRVVDVEQGANVVKIGLDDGSKVESDLVVSADGVDSMARSVLFPGVDIQDTGITLLRGFVPEAEIKRVFSATVLAKFENGNTQLFASSPKGGWWLGHLLPKLAEGADRMFQWIYYFPTSSEERDLYLTDSDGIKQRWGTSRDKTTRTTRTKLRELLDSYFPKQLMPLAGVGAVTAHRCCRMLVPNMTEGRICLAGDAAHITPPWGVGGSSLAIADGVSLAAHLSATQSLQDGLTAWSAERIGEAKAMLAQAMRIQENTLTHPIDFATATEDEIDSWVGSFLPPGALQELRVFGNEEQQQIFES